MADSEKVRHPTRHLSRRTLTAGLSLRSGSVYKFVVKKRSLDNARWLDGTTGEERTTARSGASLELVAAVKNPKEQTPRFAIFERDADGEDDPVATVEGRIEDGLARATWAYTYVDDEDEEGSGKPYTSPELYFRCTLGELSTQSGLLAFEDFVELVCRDAAGQPRSGLAYTLTLPDGSSRQGTLDDQGRARVEGVPPGRYSARFEAPEDDEPALPVLPPPVRRARRSAGLVAAGGSPDPTAPPAEDFVEIECVGLDGAPQAGLPYILELGDGEERRGTLDEHGCARIEGIPPGRYRVRIDPAA